MILDWLGVKSAGSGSSEQSRLEDVDRPPSPNVDPVLSAVVLVDFDNFYPGSAGDLAADRLRHEINRMVSLVLDSGIEQVDQIAIRLYGGWLEDGVLTKRASALQALVGTLSQFSFPKPKASGLIRVSVELVTRLLALPDVEWGHTRRVRDGLPRVQLVDKPLPMGCKGELGTCPLRTFHRFTLRANRTCHVPGCTVDNRSAFQVTEQKMVDTLICCDALTLSLLEPRSHVFILSDDLDVVPAVAVAKRHSDAVVQLVRTANSAQDLYEDELGQMGVALTSWAAA